jgi:GH15 family glucan-1,4-alpha-glucosidase
VRDTALFINTLFRLGYSGEAQAFFQFIVRQCVEHPGAAAATAVPVLLPIRNETPVEQQPLDHLTGYGGSQPVRRGNRATHQLQLDNYGHLLQSLFFWTHTGGTLDTDKRRMAEAALDRLRRCWCAPDNGIWESPEPEQHTYGKVSAWLAFQRGCNLGLISQRDADDLCRQIHAHVLRHAVRQRHGQRYLAGHYDDGVLTHPRCWPLRPAFCPRHWRAARGRK